jgi:uncharacterized membrane protein
MANNKYTRWLQGELPHWVQQQLLSAEQAASIELYYRQQAGSSGGLSIFSAIGAILFGLGIILFFAYNWADMHRFIKLTIIFSFIIASHLGALWFDARQRRSTGEGLALLGTLLFGAGIWLVSQVYHIDEHYPNAFWFWGLAALAMGWARQSAVQCLAAIALLFTWGCLEMFDFNQPLHSSPWWILAGTLPLAWRLRSPWLLLLSTSAFFVLWIFSLIEQLQEASCYVLFAFTVLLVQAGLLSSRTNTQHQWGLRTALCVPGFLIYMGIVFALTFVNYMDEIGPLHLFENTLQTGFFWGSMTASIALSFLALLPLPHLQRSRETDKLHTVLMLVTTLLVFLVGPGWLDLSYGMLSGMMNLIFIGHCLLFILHGSQQQHGKEVAAGCLLFATLVFARYSDLFDSLLSRAAVFLVLGASLFVVGNFYSRQKKSGSPADSAATANGGNAP